MTTTGDQKTAHTAKPAAPATGRSAPAPVTAPLTGYAPVNGLELYYEVHGAGVSDANGSPPLVLLHGGLLTIELNFAELLPLLAADRTVVAAELQGHGRTADIGREMSMENLAADITGLLDHLGIDQTDVYGFSLGGLVALQLAISHPGRVNRLAAASAHYRPDGYHSEIRDPDAQAGSPRMPTEADFHQMHEAYARVAPDPAHFEEFAAKLSGAVDRFAGWSPDDLRAIAAPTLLIFGDTDFVRLEHAIEMYELIPDARLAVLPGTTHMEVVRRTGLVAELLGTFLGSP